MRGRYVFEHVMLPYLLDRRGADFAGALISRGGSLLAALYASACANSDDGECDSFTESDFAVDASRLTEATACISITLPSPKTAPDCACVYILSDSSPFKASYFTLEKGDGDKIYLCGQDGDIHFIVKEYDGDEKSAIELMLGIHQDKETSAI